MILAGHQPNYLPYLGFFHKVARADVYAIVDTVQFVKRGPFGFQNRAKIRTGQGWMWLTVPVLTKGRYHQTIEETRINNQADWRHKHWRSLVMNYERAPCFAEHRSFFEAVYGREWECLVALNETLIRYLIDALAIPGGESTAMSRLAVDLGVLQPIRFAIADGMPALGTCAGMIMLADTVLDGRHDQRTFGGLDITVRRNAFGRQVESFEAPVTMPPLEGPEYPGVFIRAPWVERMGEQVAVWGTIPADSATRIVAVRQGGVLATAFHPELTGDDRIHRKFLTMI